MRYSESKSCTQQINALIHGIHLHRLEHTSHFAMEISLFSSQHYAELIISQRVCQQKNLKISQYLTKLMK